MVEKCIPIGWSYPTSLAEQNEKSEPFSHRKKVRIFLIWWARVDSNHRSIKQQIYSLSPLATREHAHIHFCHPALVLPADLFSLPRLLWFVKKFFQLSFFDLCSAAAGAGLLAYFITGGRFCQRLISSFLQGAQNTSKFCWVLSFFHLYFIIKCSGNRDWARGFGLPQASARP